MSNQEIEVDSGQQEDKLKQSRGTRVWPSTLHELQLPWTPLTSILANLSFYFQILTDLSKCLSIVTTFLGPILQGGASNKYAKPLKSYLPSSQINNA